MPSVAGQALDSFFLERQEKKSLARDTPETWLRTNSHTQCWTAAKRALPSVGDKVLGQRQGGAALVVREPSVLVKRTDPFDDENMVQMHFASRIKRQDSPFRQR